MIGTPFGFCERILVRYFPQMGFLIEASHRKRNVQPPDDWELSVRALMPFPDQAYLLPVRKRRRGLLQDI